MHLCQGLIFIWIAFHHARITHAASLRGDNSFHDEIKSYPDQKLIDSYIEQSTDNQESDEYAKFRPMLPYERRNRPIFTSKTYFGRNQMKELPRKYWANKEDKTISTLRVKASRRMHPPKYVPQRSRLEFNHQKYNIPKVQFDEHQVAVPDQNVNPGYASREEYGPNPGYPSRDEYGPNPGYPSRDEYGPNPGYPSRDGYGLNPEYASRDEYGHPKVEYGHQNTGYATKKEYVHQNPGYATKEEYVHQNPGYAPKKEYRYHDPRYVPKEEYGHHAPGYATKEEHGRHDPGYATKEEYGHHDPGYSTKEEYGHDPGYASKEEYGHHDTGYASKEEYGHHDPGYASKEEYGHHDPGYATKEEYASEDEYNSKRGHTTNDERDTGLGFDAEEGYFINHRHDGNVGLGQEPGYVGNTKAYDLEDYIKHKLMESTIEEIQKDIHKVDKMNEDNVEKKDAIEDNHAIFINGYNHLHPSDKDSDLFSLGTDSETSTHTASNSDFNIDENLRKDELLKNSDEEKFRKIPSDITSDESEDTKELIEEFEGSGDIEIEINTLSILDREANKSARILDIFSRFNDSAQCTTPKNESGHCRGLTECPLIETMENFSSFLQYMCFQRGRLVGICCPDNPVIEVKESVDEKSSEKVKLDIQQPPDGCGLSDNTRIVGGTMSLPHEFSWMVALLRRNRFYCGGVIINNWYILTAAHCVLGIKISDLKVRLGEFDFHQRNDIQHDIPVTEIKRHALFVTSTFQHDIALLKLKRKIEYTKFIGSICLPNKDEDFSKKNATVAGWGTVSFGGAASPILRKVTVPVWDNKECDRTYIFERINESFMCAGSSVSGEDACQGDSGGPLMSVNDDDRWEVIGIVSWGRRCGDPSYPGVYTRVTSYLDWIAENAQ